ncbi:NUDIX hydrolase domain-like protein [Amylostereum chailletii]|nr:NUDIX hydrolase domain-like protein [Amylostereum chailletii]
MALPKVPTSQYTADEFLICGGSILFRNLPPSSPLEICLLFHSTRQEWILPKGRKDQDESISNAVIRETYEETGYPCKLLPVKMETRAPSVGSQTKDAVVLVEECCEPFMMTLRQVNERNVKLIWWYITVVDGERVDGTQTAVENYVPRFMPVDEALQSAEFQSDRDVIERAIKLVVDTYSPRTA